MDFNTGSGGSGVRGAARHLVALRVGLRLQRTVQSFISAVAGVVTAP